jgi:hypothetical protein
VKQENKMIEKNSISKSGFVNLKSLGYIAKGLLLNVAILALQWWIVTYMRREANAVMTFLAFMVFFGTIGFSLKIWFYTALAFIVGAAIVDD